MFLWTCIWIQSSALLHRAVCMSEMVTQSSLQVQELHWLLKEPRAKPCVSLLTYLRYCSLKHEWFDYLMTAYLVNLFRHHMCLIGLSLNAFPTGPSVCVGLVCLWSQSSATHQNQRNYKRLFWWQCRLVGLYQNLIVSKCANETDAFLLLLYWNICNLLACTLHIPAVVSYVATELHR